MKSAFLLYENYHAIHGYLNHKGAHFKMINRIAEQESDTLRRQINMQKANYSFVSKPDLERG